MRHACVINSIKTKIGTPRRRVFLSQISPRAAINMQLRASWRRAKQEIVIDTIDQYTTQGYFCHSSDQRDRSRTQTKACWSSCPCQESAGVHSWMHVMLICTWVLRHATAPRWLLFGPCAPLQLASLDWSGSFAFNSARRGDYYSSRTLSSRHQGLLRLKTPQVHFLISARHITRFCISCTEGHSVLEVLYYQWCSQVLISWFPCCDILFPLVMGWE